MTLSKLARVALVVPMLSACALSPIDKEVKDVESFIKEATLSEATVEVLSVGSANQAVSASGSLEIAADETSTPVFTSAPQSIDIKAGSKLTITVADADKAAVGKLVLDKKKFILRYKATHNYGSPTGGETQTQAGSASYRVKLRAHVVVTPGI